MRLTTAAAKIPGVLIRQKTEMGYTTRLRVTLSPFFRRFPAKHAMMAERVNRRIAVDRKHRYIYFRIPKAANSTVGRNLLGVDEHADFNPGQAKGGFLRPNKLSRSEVRDLADRFFLFTVVRDPYARAISAYLDKIQRSNRRMKVIKALNLPPDQEVSFESFCDFLERGGLDQDAHWCRQVDLIPCGTERLHFIGRVETLHQDLAHILEQTLGHRRTDITSHRPHRTNAGERMHHIYTRETAARIRRIYAADFSAFGYPPEPCWLNNLRHDHQQMPSPHLLTSI